MKMKHTLLAAISLAFAAGAAQADVDRLLLSADRFVNAPAPFLLTDLERQALQDPLTGLANRRAFDDEVDLRTREDAPLALLILDVDHFKHINDTYGHPAGDRVLRVIAERLRSSPVATVSSRPGTYSRRRRLASL